MVIPRNEKRSCGCIVRHERVYVCEKHAELPESLRDTVSELLSKAMGEEIRSEVRLETTRLVELCRKATKLARRIIENRGCACNAAGHRCGTNLMLEDVARLEEEIP